MPYQKLDLNFIVFLSYCITGMIYVKPRSMAYIKNSIIGNIDLVSMTVKWVIQCVISSCGVQGGHSWWKELFLYSSWAELSGCVQQLYWQGTSIPLIFFTICNAWWWPARKSKHLALIKYICASCIACHCIIINTYITLAKRVPDLCLHLLCRCGYYHCFHRCYHFHCCQDWGVW